MQDIFLMLVFLSLLFTILCLMSPQKFFFFAPMQNRSKIGGVKCGLSLVVLFFFLFGLSLGTASTSTTIFSLVIVVLCSRTIYKTAFKSAGTTSNDSKQKTKNVNRSSETNRAIVTPPVATPEPQVFETNSKHLVTGATRKESYIESNKNKDRYWIPPGTKITVLGYTISDGMVYVTQDSKRISDYNKNPALIDPKLSIRKSGHDYKTSQLGYWPSYNRISPEERCCYLSWLSNGKNDPDADIGYVFLYFYGLERRLLLNDGHASASSDEQTIILSEVQRLLSIYDKNSSFSSYATSLLGYIYTDKYINSILYNQPAPKPTYHRFLPIDLKIGIAQMSRDQIPLSADWALSWYLSTPEPPVYSRTAAQRCYPEFQKLFTEKYRNIFANGIKIKPNKTKLCFEYHPASGYLTDTEYKKTTNLPDISFLRKDINKLAPLIQDCHEELDKYSRFLGRYPDKRESMDALLDLPLTLWPEEAIQKFQQLKNQITSSSMSSAMKFFELLNLIPTWENQSKNKIIQFLDTVESNFEIGMEPDCRFNGKLPKADSCIVLFLSNKEKSTDGADSSYQFATLVTHLSILVSQIDGKVSQEELDILMKQIDNWTWINAYTKKRLKAHAKWMSFQDLNMTGIKKRIEEVSKSQKELLASMLIQISQADGSVDVEEIKLLEKIFKLLDIDTTNLYNHMNQSSFEPITVSIASQKSNDFPIPPPPSERSSSALQLDMSKVAAIRADSEKVASLLNEIFSSDESNSSPKEELFNNKNIKSACLWGLSVDLSTFVYLLANKSTWKATELEQLALEHKMMLEGTLEEINDAAFDTFDEPLIDNNGDVFEVNQEIIEVILKNE